MYWIYFFKIVFSFSMLYILFWLFLRKTTFHQANRFLLLAIVILSFVIPIVNIAPSNILVPQNSIPIFDIGQFDGFIDSIEQTSLETNKTPMPIANILMILYWVVFFVLFTKLTIQLFKLIRYRLKKQALKQGKYTFIFSTENMAPFSFFYWIFIPTELHNKPNSNPIIEHEKVHARQLHTLDVLISEIFCIIFWFVPFVYSFKNSIKSVHEFLADKKVTQNKEQKIKYLQLLANETEKYTLIGLSSNFYCKTLKNRITMITKKQSSIISKARYLVLLPVAALLIQSFGLHPKADATKPTKTNNVKETPISFIQPIDADKCSISAVFGMRMHPIQKKKMMHNGIDYKAKTGTPIIASADGAVIRKEFKEGGYGKLIAIEHANGFYTLYSQLSEFKTEIGVNIKQGDIIGLVGSSGLSTGPHLHFEIRKDGEFVNPADYIK